MNKLLELLKSYYFTVDTPDLEGFFIILIFIY